MGEENKEKLESESELHAEEAAAEEITEEIVEDLPDPEEQAPDAEEPEETEESEEETAAEVSEEASPQDTQNPGEEKKKTSFFGRKKKETDKFQAQIDELTDRLKRNLAEFDNFRKRTEKEKSGMYLIGARDIVEKMLPVVDSFERGLAQAQEGDAFADGMKMIYKQLLTALEEAGLTPIDAVGKEFDPNLHNAVMHVEDESFGENIVAEELQKGYMFKDTVVRHSMVKVAN